MDAPFLLTITGCNQALGGWGLITEKCYDLKVQLHVHWTFLLRLPLYTFIGNTEYLEVESFLRLILD